MSSPSETAFAAVSLSDREQARICLLHSLKGLSGFSMTESAAAVSGTKDGMATENVVLRLIFVRCRFPRGQSWQSFSFLASNDFWSHSQINIVSHDQVTVVPGVAAEVFIIDHMHHMKP